MFKTYLYGGVGNQLFQYFLLYGAGQDFQVSTLFLKNYKAQTSSINRLLIVPEHQQICPSIGFASEEFLKKTIKLACKIGVSDYLRIKTDGAKDLFSTPNASFFGYWQDANLFAPYRERIIGANWYHDVSFLCSHDREEVLEEGTFVVHVRKSDYLSRKNQALFSNLDATFYCNGLRRLDRQYDRLIVCTDDVQWVMQNLFTGISKFCARVQFSSEYGCRSWVDDFLLMRFSRNLIMSNSTFAWWAAFLNENNVYFPAKWYVKKDNKLKICRWEVFGE